MDIPPRRLSPSLREARRGVQLPNSRSLDQCDMWQSKMPVAGAANGSHNGISTINRLNMFWYQGATSSTTAALHISLYNTLDFDPQICKKRRNKSMRQHITDMLTPYCCLTCYYHNISGKFIRTNANSFDTLWAMAIMMMSTFFRASGGGRRGW